MRSHRWPSKAQANLRIHTVSPEPLLSAHMKYGSRQKVRPKISHLAALDGCACAFEGMSLRRTKSAKISWAGSLEARTVMIKSILTVNSVDQGQIRVYAVGHSVCIFWMHYCMVKPHCSIFRIITTLIFRCHKFWILTLFKEITTVNVLKFKHKKERTP